MRSIVVYRYRGRELHGAGKGTLADYARECLDASCPIVTWLREPASKVSSNFFYLRTLAARSNARWVGRAERRFEAPADLRRGVAIEAVCPAGADAFRERVREILDARGLFVGVLELFDASLLAMQRELGYASV